MTASATAQIVVFILILTALAVPLGGFIANVADGQRHILMRPLGWLERLLLKLIGTNPNEEMTWRRYTIALLIFNGLGIAVLFILQMIQGDLPLNPLGLSAPTPEVAMNTAISFVTNTNWQAYSGESTMSYLTQMSGLAVQNFLSAATGMAVLLVFIRGFTRRDTDTVGHFWVDLVRMTVYVLLPLSLIFALILVTQGVVQTFDGHAVVTTLQGQEQSLALGPAASQIAIKQLGTNGGGFFGVNSAHPFENPTNLANILSILAILLIPAALCFTFGHLVKDRRQGVAVFLAMLIIFIPVTVATTAAEQAGNPALTSLGVDQAATSLQPGGNMEGKEARFGVTQSTLWATATTAASNGSVNSMHDSYTPLGGLGPMWLMQLGEVVFGGVGSGLYGLLIFAIIAVFVAGLMVGRTPEYLGKKIEAREMKFASLAILLPCCAVLFGTAIAVAVPGGREATANPGPHGFSEILYALSSGANNNGSAFGGLAAAKPLYAWLISAAMLIGRFGVMVPAMAIAGSLARKSAVPVSTGTLPTHGPLFIILLVSVVLLVGALTFIPALALGPIVEHLQLTSAGVLP